MNKIYVVDDVLEQVNVDKNIEIEYIKKECLFAISEIKINIKDNSETNIKLELKNDTKLNITFNICDDVISNINILTVGNKGKIQYKYNLNKNSICKIHKFQNVNSIKEMIIANLNEEKATIEYNFKTISTMHEAYDYHIFHNKPNTNSLIKNNGVCVSNGSIIYQVSSFVPKNITGCRVNQSNRIINLTNNKCEIRPNLYIDNKDVEAFHSALIGKFSDEEMFYIMSRGIDEKNALNLLIKGFLMSDINDEILLGEVEKNINSIWG